MKEVDVIINEIASILNIPSKNITITTDRNGLYFAFAVVSGRSFEGARKADPIEALDDLLNKSKNSKLN